jgi:hypothetical protein
MIRILGPRRWWGKPEPTALGRSINIEERNNMGREKCVNVASFSTTIWGS